MAENKNGNGGPNTPRVIGSLFFVFILGLISINSLFCVYYFLDSKNYSLLSFVAVWMISIILILFIVVERRSMKKYFYEFENDIKKNYEKIYLTNQKICDHEKDLLRSNAELKNLNQEYQAATKKLFEREMELTKANKRLQELDQDKSDFVSVAAHQLRTPLTGIKWSYVALLEKETGPINEEQKKIVEQGLENINYTIDLINDLLNTTRIEEGKTELNLNSEPIGPIIREVLSQHQPVIKKKDIQIDADIPPDSSPPLWIDKEKISIVFDNIIANAVKYTPAGGKIILRHIRKGNKIEFKIRDTGIGIPEKDIPKVFGKFFRSKNAVSFQTSGSGLGLYVTKNIIEKHGGKIELESIEREGTTVIFDLPIKID